MGKTIAEKILSVKSGKNLKAGDSAFITVDLVVGTDGTTPLAISEFEKINGCHVKYPERVVIVNDHFVPAKDIKTAQAVKMLNTFVKDNDIRHYYNSGNGGICHVIVPEQGLVSPGDLIVGADSHTVTYGALGAFSTGIGSTDMACALHTGQIWFKVPQSVKVILDGKPADDVSAKDIALWLIGHFGVNGLTYCSVEFEGSCFENIDISGRLTICNMIVEMGAKNAFIPVDRKTIDYCGGGEPVTADADAEYTRVYHIDVSKVRPVVAAPYLPSNVMKVEKMDKVNVDQVLIGGCTNGRYEDFLTVHRILKGRKAAENVRLLIVPGSQDIMKKLTQSGILSDLLDAGAVISPPTCGACAGCHMGVLADGEVGLFTTNRNFYGRSGHRKSKVYLCSPETAAWTAIRGYIACC